MMELKTTQTLNMARNFHHAKLSHFRFLWLEFPYTISFSWLFFRVAIPCAGLSFKTHCMSSAKPMNINGELMVIDAGSTWNVFQSACVRGNVRIRLDAILLTFRAFSNVCVVLNWKDICLSKLSHLQTTYFESHSWGTPRRQPNHKSQESRGAVKLFFWRRGINPHIAWSDVVLDKMHVHTQSSFMVKGSLEAMVISQIWSTHV